MFETFRLARRRHRAHRMLRRRQALLPLRRGHVEWRCQQEVQIEDGNLSDAGTDHPFRSEGVQESGQVRKEKKPTSKYLSVWPHLEKLRPTLVKLLTCLCNILRAYLNCGKKWNLCVMFYVVGYIFIVTNGQILKNQKDIWPNWSLQQMHAEDTERKIF